jgi:hypothetical protein
VAIHRIPAFDAGGTISAHTDPSGGHIPRGGRPKTDACSAVPFSIWTRASSA